MKSFQLLREILDHLEEFDKEQSGKEANIQDFIHFLNKKPANKASADKRFGKAALDAQRLAMETETTIGRLISYMNRYSRYYIKKALEGSPIQGAEEFGYLALLLTHNTLPKSELIQLNMQEKTTGTEILKRLIAAGLMTESTDQTDKRVKQVSLSEKGRTAIYGVFKDMGNVSKMVTGNLSVAEKETLRDLLMKLEDYHHPIFNNRSIGSKEDLQEWVDKL